jgi:hypothetical protein
MFTDASMIKPPAAALWRPMGRVVEAVISSVRNFGERYSCNLESGGNLQKR